MNKTLIYFASTSLVLYALSVSAADNKAATSTTTSSTTTSTTTATAGAPTDPQIAAIVVTANTVDIEAGKKAKAATKNPEVKKFAQLMITDHMAVNKSATDLVKKLKVTPEESETSRALKKGGDDSMAKLKDLKGKAFDKAYVDNEVTYHQSVLDSIDKTLIPSAKNDELKNLLLKVRPNIADHLEHAKHLQSTIE